MTTRFKPMTFLAAALLASGALAATTNQIPMAASSIKQFSQPLPLLSVQSGPGTGLDTVVTFPPLGTATSFKSPLEIRICEFRSQVLPPPAPPTWTWGYVVGTSCPTSVRDTYLGPVLVNMRGTPTTIRYTNALPTVNFTNVLAYKFSTDQTLHWADPLDAEQNACHMASMDMSDAAMPFTPYVGIAPFGSRCSLNFGEDPNRPGTFLSGKSAKGIPAVPHLHGGEVPPGIDGGPDAWFTSFNGDGSVERGHDYYTNPNVKAAANQAVYSYPNTQAEAPLWFHDHTLGATRLNVYAGIAGAYYLLEPSQESWFKQIGMRPVTELVPIVLQDRMFDTNGQWYFPQDFPGGINGPPTNPQHPYWVPEFVGDTIVVNGKAWPFMNVEPRRYRFLFLNGSNARTYELWTMVQGTGQNGPPLWVIGNDGGPLDSPAAAPGVLRIMSGERYEVIIDFTSFAGKTLLVKNNAKAPYPGGSTPQGTTTGQIMQFRVSSTPVADTSYDPASGGALRPTRIVRFTDPTTGTILPGVKVNKVRQLTLNEVALDDPQSVIDPVSGLMQTYPGGPIEILVNNSRWSGETPRPYGDFTPVTINGITENISETPQEGDVELWEIINTTMDAHPIHTHLATFQVLNRQNYDTGANGYFNAAYAPAFPPIPGSAKCTGGVFCPSFGPPLVYQTSAAPGAPARTRTINGLTVPVVGGNPDVTPFLLDGGKPPLADETGWKDTFLVYPGMVNRMLVRWAPTDTALNTVGAYPFSPNDGTNGGVGDSHGYVWHCHIIDHEDNEMMRQDVIVPLAGAVRTYVKGINY
ncbi:MAG TPA: multicopper oxidase domain-containing protein [Anaeromyxobacter sp.]